MAIQDLRVGFIGFGSVGGKLAATLLRNGIDLCVHDLHDELVNGFYEEACGVKVLGIVFRPICLMLNPRKPVRKWW